MIAANSEEEGRGKAAKKYRVQQVVRIEIDATIGEVQRDRNNTAVARIIYYYYIFVNARAGWGVGGGRKNDKKVQKA